MRFNRETLEIMYKGKNIADILEMTVDEALDFFSSIPMIKRKLKTLHDVGLGYVRLGPARDDALGRRSAEDQARVGAVEEEHGPDAVHPR